MFILWTVSTKEFLYCSFGTVFFTFYRFITQDTCLKEIRGNIFCKLHYNNVIFCKLHYNNALSAVNKFSWYKMPIC